MHLKGLTKLSRLDLADPAHNIGYIPLARLSNLSHVDLGFTKVAGRGLAHLKGLTKLARLDLHGLRVADDDVNELQQALPSLKINR